MSVQDVQEVNGSEAPSKRVGHRRATGRWVALLAVLAVLAAACGSSDDDVAAEDSTATTEAAVATTEAETTTTEAEATTTEAEPEETTTTAAPDPTPVRLVFVPATTGLLVNIAQEQGYFADNGLAVELTPATNISEIIPTLGQQVDISLGTATDLIRAADTRTSVIAESIYKSAYEVALNDRKGQWIERYPMEEATSRVVGPASFKGWFPLGHTDYRSPESRSDSTREALVRCHMERHGLIGSELP